MLLLIAGICLRTQALGLVVVAVAARSLNQLHNLSTFRAQRVGSAGGIQLSVPSNEHYTTILKVTEGAIKASIWSSILLMIGTAVYAGWHIYALPEKTAFLALHSATAGFWLIGILAVGGLALMVVMVGIILKAIVKLTTEY